ncbi:hypothetical protein BVC93_09300 [Mycobacterium sp. MS1601]|uniref:prolyl oligopeptidase family serine peptidase n=1 Tax=Mycobacterium sp. MS1601 TaxID=1936029 RepID=UPI0009791D12|nr:prolyl oligopeptidase family serine peptidase [Mycobacterium sp. MS1601]AQA02595.1 hypothetical protein BVC93_09300 [Mycobacterium sp. MS1601]
MSDLRTDNPEALDWQTRLTTEAVAALHSIGSYAAFESAVLRHSDAARRWTPIRAGERWFQQRRLDPAAELPAVTVRDAVDGEPRVLVDLNDHAAPGGPPVALGWVSPSPDGCVLAYAITHQGAEINEVFLVDVASGAPLADRVPWNVCAPPTWLPDGTEFWCVTREVADGQVMMPIRRFVLGQPASDWVAPLPPDLAFPIPKVSKDGRYVAVASGNTEVRVDYLIDENLEVMRVLEGFPGFFRCDIVDDTIVALTDNGAPRNRVVQIPLRTCADPSTWTELLGESADTILDFEIFDNTMVVASLRDCSAALDVIDLPSGARTPVELPGRGGIGVLVEHAAHPALPVFERGEGEVTFLYSDLATAPAIYRYRLGDQRLECLEPPTTTLDNMTVSYVTAVSADGVEVPAHVIHRADLDLSRPHPTFLMGYGGFRVAELPAFVNGHAAWLEAGGIHVLAHLRGGGEFGADWWRGGRRDNKQNSFNDFYAIAEKLIELGWTTSAQLAAYGASNGGLLTAVAVTQRPELWAAVVSDVPITDLVGMDQNPLTYAIGRDEYGDPKIPGERQWLAAIDPLVNAKPADYPATLVIAGANDPRCPANQARMLVETLRSVHTGASPILLRVHAEQGHGAHGAIESARRLTEILAFCAVHTGLELKGGLPAGPAGGDVVAAVDHLDL